VKQKDKKSRLRDIERADEAGHAAYVIELSTRFLAEFPNSVLAHYYLATSLYSVACYAEALRVLRRLRTLVPANKRHSVHSQFGHLYRQKGDLRRAEAWYRKAASAQPQDATYHIYLGAVLAAAGRLDEAEVVHRKATRCRTGCIDEAHLNLGFVLRAQGRYSEARACFQRALKISPKYEEAKEAFQDVSHILRIKGATV
jgi:tetratricopeptide (TPR) repeat protein